MLPPFWATNFPTQPKIFRALKVAYMAKFRHISGLYYKYIIIVNDAARVIRMTIVSDTTTWCITYDHNNFIVQATGHPDTTKNITFLNKFVPSLYMKRK